MSVVARGACPGIMPIVSGKFESGQLVQSKGKHRMRNRVWKYKNKNNNKRRSVRANFNKNREIRARVMIARV